MNHSVKNQESRIRRLAERHGCYIRKSRARKCDLDNLGDYMLVDANLNCLVLGERLDATLDDIALFFSAQTLSTVDQSRPASSIIYF